MSKMSHSLVKRLAGASTRLAVAFAPVVMLPRNVFIRTTVRAGALLIGLLTIASIRPAVLQHLQLETEAAAVGVCPRTDPNYPTCRPPTDCATRATVSLSVSPVQIRKGDSATVRWSVSLPSNCRRLTLSLNGRDVATQGSMVVTPLATGSYFLKLGAVTLANATVTVGLPRKVRIDGSTWEWRRLLIQAVGTDDTVVVLRHDVDMDLTGELNIPFGRNVTLMSEAPQVGDLGLRSGVRSTSWFARDSRHLGPRLYTLGHPKNLFYIRCDGGDGENARLLGFRLQGPSLGREDDDPAGGVMLYGCRTAEIAQMEISGWAGWGIAVRNSGSTGIHIHDNFIHHNENKGAPGYGIDIQDAGYALIERNVFDFNRHAIAGSGDPGTSYNARHNLVLRGGGKHGKPWNVFTHQFDVHGDDHCAGPIPSEWAPVVVVPVLPVLVPGYPLLDPDGPGIDTPIDNVYNCGNAGSEFVFTNNAFQYRSDRAIKLRGKPREAAYIYDNVFAHEDLDDAVAPLDDLHVHAPKARNTVRADTYGQYGVCDFDGDGKDDLFLATGANWWYSSAGRMNWTFLAPHTERLNQVGLGDFTGDGRCDVFAVRYRQWAMSDGGTSDWQLIPGNYTDFPFDRLAFGDFNGDKRKDIFHRAANGQWSVISPGVHDWRDLARLSTTLTGLRFGDFDGDGVTDVLSRSGGVWSVSWSGETDWQPLPSRLSDSLTSILIANVDGIPGDDMVRFVVIDRHNAKWEISSGGMTGWQTFATMEWPARPLHGPLSETVFSFVGNFDNVRGADLLMVDQLRMSHIFRNTDQTFRPHGMYAY